MVQNIPALIRKLLKTDGVLKNLRIVFTDDSYPDVCNDKIIKESLKFEESLSSREEIKFGLCEDATLDFECLDFGDIQGKEIVAYFEIDATELFEHKMKSSPNKPPILTTTYNGTTYHLHFCDYDYSATTIQSNDGSELAYNELKAWYIDTNYFEAQTGITLSKTGASQGISSAKIYLYSGKNPNTIYRIDYAECKDTSVSSNYDWSQIKILATERSTDFDTIKNAFGNPCYVEMKNEYYAGQPDVSDIPYLLPPENVTDGKVGSLFWHYLVQIGVFVVDECKLNVAKGRRKVKASTHLPDLYHPSVANKALMNTFFTLPLESSIKFYPFNYMIMNNRSSFDFVLSYSAKTLTTGTETKAILGYTTYTLQAELTLLKYGSSGITNGWSNENMVMLGNKPAYAQTAYNSLMALYENIKSNYPSDKQQDIVNLINYVCNNVFRVKFTCNGTRENPNSTTYEQELKWNNLQLPLNSFIYSHAKFTAKNGSTVISTVDVDLYPASALTVLDATVTGMEDFYINLHPAYEIYEFPYGGGTAEHYGSSFYEFLSTLDTRKMLSSVLELHGWYGNNRYGRIRPVGVFMFQCSALLPSNRLFPADDLYPSDFEYDEAGDDTSGVVICTENETISLEQQPDDIVFGALICNYMSSEHLDENNEPTKVTYTNTWDENGLVYDASDNLIIQNNVFSDSSPEPAIKTYLAKLVEALKDISYRRTDAKTIGLPYMDAGDWMIAAQNGTALAVLNLRHKISGIQALQDTIIAD